MANNQTNVEEKGELGSDRNMQKEGLAHDCKISVLLDKFATKNRNLETPRKQTAGVADDTNIGEGKNFADKAEPEGGRARRHKSGRGKDIKKRFEFEVTQKAKP